MIILVTGAAGFIGYHLCAALLAEGHRVVGLDNLDPYYSVQLKQDRLARLEHAKFSFCQIDLAEAEQLAGVFKRFQFQVVVNLAAQAGVRHSLICPEAYVRSNLVGFANLLECCRQAQVRHLVYASTSSVYGLNRALPFSEHHCADHPVSLYAATKKANEAMAHSYSHLFDLPTTGLRFFTVYGPWGRPDMALFSFTEAILAGKPIQLFNQGRMNRDFTYIDDIIQGLMLVLDNPPKANPDWDAFQPDPGSSSAPYRLFNIGKQSLVGLETYVATLEQKLGKTALIEYLPMQAGDVVNTQADIFEISKLGYLPHTAVDIGIDNFVRWYREYFQV